MLLLIPQPVNQIIPLLFLCHLVPDGNLLLVPAFLISLLMILGLELPRVALTNTPQYLFDLSSSLLLLLGPPDDLLHFHLVAKLLHLRCLQVVVQPLQIRLYFISDLLLPKLIMGYFWFWSYFCLLSISSYFCMNSRSLYNCSSYSRFSLIGYMFMCSDLGLGV